MDGIILCMIKADRSCIKYIFCCLTLIQVLGCHIDNSIVGRLNSIDQVKEKEKNVSYTLTKKLSSTSDVEFPIEFDLIFSSPVASTDVTPSIFSNTGSAKNIDIKIIPLGDEINYLVQIISVQSLGNIELKIENLVLKDQSVTILEPDSFDIVRYIRKNIEIPDVVTEVNKTSASSNDWLALGSEESGNGIVTLYKRENNSWQLFQEIIAPDLTNKMFGGRLSLSENWLMISDIEDNEFYIDGGAVYFYEFNGSQWNKKDRIVPPDVAGSAKFGQSISISGNKSIVGVDALDKIYFIHYNGMNWEIESDIIELPSADGFGYFVSIDNDTAVVGRPWEDNVNGIDAGAALIYSWNGTVWNQDQIIRGDGRLLDRMGACVQIHEDVIFFGQFSVNLSGRFGYIYEKNLSGTWELLQDVAFPSSYGSHSFTCGIRLNDKYFTVVDVGLSYVLELPSTAYVFYRGLDNWVVKNRLDEIGSARIGNSIIEVRDDSVLMLEGEIVSEIVFSQESGRGVTISAEPLDIDEGLSANLPIYFLGEFTEPIELHVYTIDDRAKAGFDYLAIDTNVVVQPGTTTINIPIVTLENSSSGGFNDFTFHLETLSVGNVLFDSVIIQIINNDFPSTTTASDAVNYDYFGNSLAASGDWLYVGASDSDISGTNSGSAYFFQWSGTNWIEKHKFVPIEVSGDDRFGIAGDLNSDKAVIGAIRDDDMGADAGAIYAYKLNSGTWSQTQKITASDAAAGAGFGSAIKVDNSKLAVGAQYSNAGEGQVYVFDWNGTQWNESEIVAGSDLTTDSHFGASVDMKGDWMIVGALGESFNAGGAYIFNWDGANWVEKSKFLPDGSWFLTHCARYVAIEYPWAVMGCPYENGLYGNFSGSVYVYFHNGVEWSQSQILLPDRYRFGFLEGSYFGSGLNISSGIMSVGTSGSKGVNYNSTVSLFTLSNNLWTVDKTVAYPDGSGFVVFNTTFSNDQIIMGNGAYNSTGAIHSFPIDP